MTIKILGHLGSDLNRSLRELLLDDDAWRRVGVNRGQHVGRFPIGLHFKPKSVGQLPTKNLDMPRPDGDGADWNKTLAIRVFKRPKKTAKRTKKPKNDLDRFGLDAPKELWPLYDKSKGLPHYKDVQQGHLLSCPLASILTAVAYTRDGPARIQKMITEHAGRPTKTTDRHTKKAGKNRSLTSKRYFTVSFPGKSVEVSEALWTDDPDDATPVPTYMRSPNQVLWPCLIEKAYAKWKGGYNIIGATSITVDEVWKDLLGSKPTELDLRKNAVERATSAQVVLQASRADREPMIVTLNDIRFHGMAVIGVRKKTSRGKTSSKSRIKCWDAYGTKVDPQFSIDELRGKAQSVLFFGKL